MLSESICRKIIVFEFKKLCSRLKIGSNVGWIMVVVWFVSAIIDFCFGIIDNLQMWTILYSPSQYLIFFSTSDLSFCPQWRDDKHPYIDKHKHVSRFFLDWKNVFIIYNNCSNMQVSFTLQDFLFTLSIHLLHCLYNFLLMPCQCIFLLFLYFFLFVFEIIFCLLSLILIIIMFSMSWTGLHN